MLLQIHLTSEVYVGNINFGRLKNSHENLDLISDTMPRNVFNIFVINIVITQNTQHPV